ncbi:MAG: substrate-binding domain-containing protein [Ignavibacteria bacterium]|nr:substrate-binding domain-containing protein [Ignavibacteria bacterium]
MRLRTAFSIVASSLFVYACAQETTTDNKPSETAIRGSVEILCDEQIVDLMGPSKILYDSVHPDAHVTLTPINALDAADALIRHDARAIVIGRDWIPEEDTIIKNDKGLEGYPRSMVARDALVFFASKKFPYDTMHADNLNSYIASGTFNSKAYPKLKKPPVLIVPGSNSSIYGNVVNMICKGKPPAKGIITSLGNREATMRRVGSDPGVIGIGLLSQFIRDTTVKLIRLSYTDSNGVYETPKPVHASYIVMGKYPYPVPIYIVLRENVGQYSLPSGYLLYVARDGKAQRTFLDAGIEPGYAKIELITED